MSNVLEAARYKLKLTPEEFFEIVGEDDKAELIDGEVIVASPAGVQHGYIQRFLLTILNLFVRGHQLGEVFGEQIAMRLGQNVFIPDISFLTNAHQDRLEPGYIQGPVDLALELVSPDDPDRDRVRKRTTYAQAGVREYWLIDLQSRQITPYRLEPQGQYTPIAPDERGYYHSEVVPGFFLHPDWLWPASGQLDEFAALRALGVLA
jgi:Uma2 family endonuclease